VLQTVDREKTRQASAAQGLQERLTRAQEEISSLQTSITERSSHYQQLHNQLLDKATQATSLEKEVSLTSIEFCRVLSALLQCLLPFYSHIHMFLNNSNNKKTLMGLQIQEVAI